MRAKYIYELCEEMEKKEVLELLVTITLDYFRKYPKKAEELWYGGGGIVEKSAGHFELPDLEVVDFNGNTDVVLKN